MVAVEGKLSPRILGGKRLRSATSVSFVASHNEHRSLTNDQTRYAESFGIGIAASVPQRTTTTGIFTTTTRRHNDGIYHEGTKSRRVINEQRTSANERLDRLTAVTRGGAAYQSWNLDSQGNWSSSTTGTVTQTETANAQNQITSITGTAGTPAYDSNGNMTTDQAGNKLVYDAWNRLISVTNSAGQLIAQYSYNAMGWRVTSYHPTAGPGGTVLNENIYYSASWQRIETRVNGDASTDVASQYVWSVSYVDGLVLRDSYANGTLQASSRVYALQDADWNVTALVGYDSGTNTWAVSERFVFDSYGNVQTFSASWQAATDTLSWQVLAQGRFRDLTTGLDDGRARIYSASLGRWISQDPAGYINGADAYQMEASNPVAARDPSGLFWSAIGGFFHGITNGIGGALYNLGQLGAPATNYVVNTLTYPGDRLLGLPTNRGLGWGQGSLVVGLIQESPSFQQKSQAWLKQIVAEWSRSEGCKSGSGKIADRKTLDGLSIYNPSQFMLSSYNIIGQLTIGRFVAHAFATGPVHQVCRNGGVVGGASLAIQYDVSDTFHLHLGNWEPGQFNQTIHWTGSQYVAIARKC